MYKSMCTCVHGSVGAVCVCVHACVYVEECACVLMWGDWQERTEAPLVLRTPTEAENHPNNAGEATGLGRWLKEEVRSL